MAAGWTPIDLWAALRRRWFLFSCVAALAAALSFTLALRLPPVYSATAKILVEEQQIPSELARSTVTSSPAERLELIRQRIMTRENMLDLARRMEVFPNAANTAPSDVVEALRSMIEIEAILTTTGGRPRGQTEVTAFTITFTGPSPVLVARVTNELVNMVLEHNLQTRASRAAETLEFFRNDVVRLSENLAAIELQIADFKRENKDSLPESLGFRWSELSDLRNRLTTYEESRITLQDEMRAIEAVLAGDSAAAASAARAPTPNELELRKLRQDLVLLRSQFTETHPQVRALAARIVAVESLVAAEGDLSDPATGSAASAIQSDLRRKLAGLEAELAELERRRLIDEVRRSAIEESIARTPEVEMALNGLYRAYKDLQSQYEVAVAKAAEASTGERLEANQQAERFELVEPAIVPEKPIAPKRALIAAGGTVGGIVLGLALALIGDLLDRTIHTRRDLERRLGISAVATIPLIATRGEVIRRRVRKTAVAVVIMAGTTAGLYIVDARYMPLAQIGEKILDVTRARALIDLFGGGATG